jgi:hypothetical protein
MTKINTLMFNLEHTLISLVLQIILFFVFSSWWIGAVLVSGIFIGREYAQAEYRWITQYSKGLRENIRWYDHLDPAVWNFYNSFWNMVLPIICVFAMVIINI